MGRGTSEDRMKTRLQPKREGRMEMAERTERHVPADDDGGDGWNTSRTDPYIFFSRMATRPTVPPYNL